MATMKGVIVEAVGSPYKFVEDLSVPEPSDAQILVKSIATAINPAYVSFSSIQTFSPLILKLLVLRNGVSYSS